MKSLRLAGFIIALAGLTAASATAFAADIAGAKSPTQRLFDAIRANDVAAVHASLAAGADPEATDRWGVRPVDLAVDKGYYRIAHVLTAARLTARTAQPRTSAVAPPATVAAKDPAAAATPSRSGKTARHGQAAKPAPASPLIAASAPAAATPPTTADVAWPADVPNPFDPSTPPPRSQLKAADSGDATVAQ